MLSALVWFRRDLRLDDNAALSAALQGAEQVHCAFVFDTDILGALTGRADRRVAFIHGSVAALKAALEARGGGLYVLHGSARQAIPTLAARLGAEAVFAARDYEPFARARDEAVAQALSADGRTLHRVKDQVVFDTDDILTSTGKPFHVFTPYKRAWLTRVDAAALATHPVAEWLHRLAPGWAGPMPSLAELEFERLCSREWVNSSPASGGGTNIPAHAGPQTHPPP